MDLNVYVVSKVPDFAPDEDRVVEARKFIYKNFRNEARYISFKVHSHRKAVGSFINIDRLTCPRCSQVLQMWADELDGWTGRFHDELFGSAAPLETAIAMPCCKGTALLGEFNFGGAIKFSRIELSLRDVFVEKIDAAVVARLESIIGCGLMQFSAGET